LVNEFDQTTCITLSNYNIYSHLRTERQLWDRLTQTVLLTIVYSTCRKGMESGGYVVGGYRGCVIGRKKRQECEEETICMRRRDAIRTCLAFNTEGNWFKRPRLNPCPCPSTHPRIRQAPSPSVHAWSSYRYAKQNFNRQAWTLACVPIGCTCFTWCGGFKRGRLNQLTSFVPVSSSSGTGTTALMVTRLRSSFLRSPVPLFLPGRLRAAALG
jgi:hypothetical protein